MIGWLIVLVLPLTGMLPVDEATPALPIMLFVLVILVARALAFRLTEGSVLSLDSAYYVAAALSVGSIEAGRLELKRQQVEGPPPPRGGGARRGQ